MALPTASDNAFPSLLVTEGTVPTSPAAGKQRVYIDSTTHRLKRVNSSGATFILDGGAKLDYTTFTDITVTGTTEGGAQTIATSASIACDGVMSVYGVLSTPRLIQGTAAGNGIVIDWYVDSTIQGRVAVFLNPAGAADDQPLHLETPEVTPSNASHTFTFKAWRIGANGTVSGGAGGTGTNVVGYTKVIRA